MILSECTLHDGPQSIAFQSPATEILYGGAAGGGKSFLIRISLIIWCLAVPGLQCYLFRRTFRELFMNHMEGPSSFPLLLNPWIKNKQVNINYQSMKIMFANGSVIHLCNCQYEKNRLNYHGAEIHVLAIDELTTFTATIYYYLRGRVRMVGLDLPPNCPWAFPRILCGTNPGGIGHTFAKADWVTSANPYEIHRASEDDGGMLRQYIPARLTDNPTLMREDPGYIGRLAGLGSPELVRALREGSWDILEGAMFTDVWDEAVNWIDPFPLPQSWRLTRSFDWGSSKPFSVGWWATCDGTQPTDEDGNRILDYTIPAKSKIRIAEWYGWNGKANQGCKLLPKQIAKGILEREQKLGILGQVYPGAADSAIFDTDRGESIATKMEAVRLNGSSAKVKFKPASKGPGSRVRGWEVVREMLKAAQQRPMEAPALLIFNRCTNFRRTIPELPRDETKTDDINTESEDHIADETRYELTLPSFGATRAQIKGA